MKTIYENHVKSIGNMAQEFLQEKMLILFGDEAPAGLKDYCYAVDLNPIDGKITTGDQVAINDQVYRITAVGNLVQKNLVNLGHITMKFDGSTKADLAGTLYLEDKEVPAIQVGTKISIQEAESDKKEDGVSA
jgi:Phosphotransferase system sorbitol-specific component IIA